MGEYAEVVFLQAEHIGADCTAREVKDALRVKGATLVAGLKVEVGAGAAAGAAAKTDNFSSPDRFASLYKQFGKMTVVGLQTVGVAQDNQIAVTSGAIAGGYADHAVKSRFDTVAGVLLKNAISEV